MVATVPAIIEDPQDVIIGVGLGKNTTFSCSANGGPTSDPALVFTWIGPDGVDTSNNADEMGTSVLTLVNVTEDHEGSYNCSVAYNDMPTITSTSEIATLSAVSK